MKLTYGGQTVDLFDKFIPEKILLKVSGGLDSASLFYLILKHFPQVEIIPLTGRDVTAPFDYECALDIVQFMREKFPKGKIAEHEVYEFDIQDPLWIEKARQKWEEEHVTLPDGTRVPRATKLSGLVKILMMRHYQDYYETKYPDIYTLTGMTANPPVEEQQKYGFYDVAERRRDDKNQNPWGKLIYQPYIGVDKKFVAGIYKDERLLKTLYPYTSSCVGFPNETNYYIEPCGECFWCKEKEWAFET